MEPEYTYWKCEECGAEREIKIRFDRITLGTWCDECECGMREVTMNAEPLDDSKVYFRDFIPTAEL